MKGFLASNVRLRSKVEARRVKQTVNKILTDKEWDMLITGGGPTKVVGPAGETLGVYLPRALASESETHWDLLASIKHPTGNRFNASGGRVYHHGRLSRTHSVNSSIIGWYDQAALPNQRACRLTSWTGKHLEEFNSLYPMFHRVSELFREYVPDRWAVQNEYARRTPDAFCLPADVAPFTTMTINNTYPTGVHKDKGDLDEGFSCLAVMRRGAYRGGYLVLPEYRVAFDMRDGDLLLMDAHNWHGNTAIRVPRGMGCCYPPSHVVEDSTFEPPSDIAATLPDVQKAAAAGEAARKRLYAVEAGTAAAKAASADMRAARKDLEAAQSGQTWPERVSVVLYYRTEMTKCAKGEKPGSHADWQERPLPDDLVERSKTRA